MSDLKLLNIKTSKCLKAKKYYKHEIRELIENNLEELLGIKLLCKDYNLISTEDFVEVLGYDENYQLVVIEYRMGKFSSTINKGLIFLDYIKANRSKVKTIINSVSGYELSNMLKYDPRLIIVGDDFNKYDEYAIKQMPYVIDLIKYQVYDNKFLLLEKNYQSTKIIKGTKPSKFKDESEFALYKTLSEFILSLGDEVCEVNANNFISYRKIKNFIYMMVNEGIELRLKRNNNFKTLKIKSIRDFEKFQNEIEACYDEN